MTSQLHHLRASFEKRSLSAPQDEENQRMALRKTLILRRFAERSLEGRYAVIQP